VYLDQVVTRLVLVAKTGHVPKFLGLVMPCHGATQKSRQPTIRLAQKSRLKLAGEVAVNKMIIAG